MSSSCLSDIFIIWYFFKALLIPCEIPVDNQNSENNNCERHEVND